MSMKLALQEAQHEANVGPVRSSAGVERGQERGTGTVPDLSSQIWIL